MRREMPLVSMRLLRAWLFGLYLGVIFISTTIGFFLVAESNKSFRELLNLHSIRYFDFLDRYELDPKLVFVYPESEGNSFTYETKGDLYSDSFNVDVDPLPFSGTYNRFGFRSAGQNTGQLVFVGDSFIEIGETDQDLLSERVGQKLGLATANLGRGWYGPYQYLEMLRRYVLPSSSSCVIFSFFSGNDIRDIVQFENWIDNGSYYDWRPIGQNFWNRYFVAVVDTLRLVRQRLHAMRRYLSPPAAPTSETIHPELGLVELGDEEIAMAFAYRETVAPPEMAVASDEWRTLRSIITQFRDEAAQNGISTVIVFIPTKMEVYSPFISKGSGANLLKAAEGIRGSESNAADSLRLIAVDLHIPFIDLLSAFRVRAKQGEVLYYPFDTHWNSLGRQAGAEVIAAALREQRMCGSR